MDISAQQLGATQQALEEFQTNADSMEKIAAYARACWAPDKVCEEITHNIGGLCQSRAVDGMV